MTPGRYRKLPVVIEAVRLDAANVSEVADWCGGRVELAAGMTGAVAVLIATLEGVMRAGEGDWVACGVQGEFYPIRGSIFDLTYEAAG